MTQKSLYAVITALPGKEEEIAKLLKELAVKVRAEAGCVRFLPYRLVESPQVFHIHETYEDEAAFKTHISQEHGKIFNEKLKSLAKGGGSEVNFLKAVVE
ncbi:antibiotic biosynthesis monooxygenase [Acetobacteraceae bacterium]|nr:antibiotic biosynthesis monooxygenase [Acetobacteraceae bacterium]